MYSSGVSTRDPTSPVGRRPVGMSRAPGTNSERKRSQFRGPGGPEITSYNEATMASMVATSAGFAAGVVAGVGAAAGEGVPVGAGVCAPTLKTANNSTLKRPVIDSKAF